MAEKKWFTILLDGLTDSGARTGSTPMKKYATSSSEAKKMAKETFKKTRNVVKVTRCDNVTKK